MTTNDNAVKITLIKIPLGETSSNRKDHYEQEEHIPIILETEIETVS